MGKGLVPPEKPITPSKEHLFIYISCQVFHVGILNLINADHPGMHIIQQHQPPTSLDVSFSPFSPCIQTYLSLKGRTFETSAFPTPLFALPKLPVFFCEDLASSIHAWERLSPKDPDTTCKGIPLSCGQMPSQHNTLPHTNDILPPTCCRYFQTWQLDCHVQIQER
jgi:hypothetical protein